MKSAASRRYPTTRVRGTTRRALKDSVTVEEPLEVRIRHGSPASQTETNLGVSMRTPGHDEELVAGMLVSEGIVTARSDLVHIARCFDPGEKDYGNVLVAELASHVSFQASAHERPLVRTSACGVCGSASVEHLLERPLTPLPKTGPLISDAVLRTLPDALSKAQRVFQATGGIHAAALVTAAGRIELLREDVGRHNAVDKIVGERFLKRRLPLGDRFLLVSGRAGFEIVQKARAAGLPLVAAIGAPSSLAVDVAKATGVTLVGFLKPDGYNVYAHAGRVAERGERRAKR